MFLWFIGFLAFIGLLLAPRVIVYLVKHDFAGVKFPQYDAFVVSNRVIEVCTAIDRPNLILDIPDISYLATHKNGCRICSV